MGPQSKWDTQASDAVIQKTVESLKKRNVAAHVVKSREEALAKLQELIPVGSEVMTGSSTTLDEIGFSKLLNAQDGPYKSYGAAVRAENDEAKRNSLRRQAVLVSYFLGSVHAVAESGEIVVASRTGSQLPAYVMTSPHVIWVAGTQKIVPTLNDALDRVRHYVLPLEDQRMKKAMGPQSGSSIGKLVIIENEITAGRLTMIFVKENLGF